MKNVHHVTDDCVSIFCATCFDKFELRFTDIMNIHTLEHVTSNIR